MGLIRHAQKLAVYAGSWRGQGGADQICLMRSRIAWLTSPGRSSMVKCPVAGYVSICALGRWRQASSQRESGFREDSVYATAVWLSAFWWSIGHDRIVLIFGRIFKDEIGVMGQYVF